MRLSTRSEASDPHSLSLALRGSGAPCPLWLALSRAWLAGLCVGAAVRAVGSPYTRSGCADSSHECAERKTTPASQLHPLQSTTAAAFTCRSEFSALDFKLCHVRLSSRHTACILSCFFDETGYDCQINEVK